jgi:hypothetical protein
MDVFKYKKLPQRSNDSSRRYQLVRGMEGDHVGEVEVGGDAPEGNTVRLILLCFPILSDAAREDALSNTMRFLAEMASGWGLQLGDSLKASEWAEQPDGTFWIWREYEVV